MYTSIRKPFVAGQFYPSDHDDLLDEIKRHFLSKLGPGKLPESKESFTGKLVGIVAPHAGYIYSGPIAAHGYYEMALSGKPDLVFILGPNHHAFGDPIALSSYDAWETPLGTVKIDKNISKEIIQRSGIVSIDDRAHMYEHSIEVQIPFLQFIFGSDISIVPVSMLLQNPESSKILGEAIASIILEHRLKAYVVASSDFSHYVESRIAKKKDYLAISKILDLDYKGLFDVVIENDISMCGPGPVMTLMVVAKEIDVEKGVLLKYASSGDVTGDYSSVVAYASIAFYK